MNFELMSEVTNGKPMWDQLTAYISGAVYLVFQTALSVEIETWINICVGLSIIIFALTRSYFWIKHDGYENKNE